MGKKREHSCSIGGNINLHTLWEKKNRALYDLAILSVGIYVRKRKTCFEEDICTPDGHYSIIFKIDKIWGKNGTY